MSTQNENRCYLPLRLFRTSGIIGIVGCGGFLIIFMIILTASVALQRATAQTSGPPVTLQWSSYEIDDTQIVAWGDYDSDGDLDLAVGGSHIRLYRNDTGTLTMSAVWSSVSGGKIAWGDYNGDGNLDLATDGGLYRNDSINGNSTPIFTLVLPSLGSGTWGDYDGDGDLDLATGDGLYCNDGVMNDGTPNFTVVMPSLGSGAWGDYDGDGDLDLVTHNTLYRNDSAHGNCTPPIFVAVSTFAYDDYANTLAWGDYDGDGDLDLVAGTNLYRNDTTTITPTFTLVWSPAEDDYTNSVAWGDIDGDGDLDLVTGNGQSDPGQPNRLYLNISGTLTSNAVWSSTESDWTTSVAWGDYDGDGDLDLAVGNYHQPTRLYRNDSGVLTPTEVWSPEDGNAASVAWGDYDGDGDLDLMEGRQPRLYRNDSGTLTTSAVWSSVEEQLFSSVAWGDYDGDGDLDLASADLGWIPRGHAWLYRNDGGSITSGAVWSSTETGEFTSTAWGDYDGDGDLDLVAGTNLYRNDTTTITPTFTLVWSPAEDDYTRSVAWGDIDGDGDLDLAMGGGQRRLYRNDRGTLTSNAVWSSTESDPTASVAWGDYDGDGDLDLAVGNIFAPNRLYRNDSGVLTTSAVWSSIEADTTYGIAWGDVDGDGDLDLAVGNGGNNDDNMLSRLYRNDDGVLTPSAAWSSAEANGAMSVAWGDVDNDGDLDLIVGNVADHPSRLYRNTRDAQSGLPGSIPLVYLTRPGPNADFYSASQIWSSPTIPLTYTLFDRGGFPVRRVIGQYSLDGGGQWFPAAAANGTVTTNLPTKLGAALSFDGVDDSVDVSNSVTLNITNELTLEAWVKLNGANPDQKIVGKSPIGSGYLLGVVNGYLYPEIWDANGTWYTFQAGNIRAQRWTHLAVTWQTGGDMIGYINGTPVMTATASSNPIGSSTNLLRIGASPWASAHQVQGLIDDVRVYNRVLPATEIRTTMLQALNGNESGLAGYWRFDEGTGMIAHDQTANQNNGSLINGPTWVGGHVPVAVPYTYNWDTFASGFFGASDNVVFRLTAIPAITNTANGIPGPYLYGSYASSTFPFRVRGSQVRVLSGAVPISNALVYRLPVSQTVSAHAYADLSGKPFRTDNQGYLQGRGQLSLGDRLVALYPITSTDSYILYYTSAAPTTTGLSAYTITGPGVQTLTVSSAHPLILFNLDVSLEWDARKDAQFMSQLQFDLQRASEYLYDWTNGQAALGQVAIYQDREKWLDAHMRIYASNRLRPSATQGGIISPTLTEVIINPPTSTLPITITYYPGQVRMGAVWNRYGDPGASLSDDWPRTLAHELGHYALFLDDDYLGLDANGLLIPVDTCTGTAMSDPYRDDYSEFHYATDWLPGCANTLANKSTGRSDWTTIKTFYPWLNNTTVNSGPTGLPLAVTQIKVVEPVTSTATLDVPVFYLTKDGGRYQPGSSARVFLFQGDRVTDLGRPTLDQVLARGARPGDRVCVYELAAQRLGCETITLGDEQLAMVSKSGWQPEVVVSPVTSRTINISVTVSGVPSTMTLKARLFPVTDPAPPAITLALTPDKYVGTFTLAEPALEGYVQVWVNEPEPRREIVTDYALGGDPGYVRGHGGYVRGHGGYIRGHGAPAISADGQVILFGDNLVFPPDEFIALQAVTSIPSAPAWATVVGQAYRLTASTNITSLNAASISFSYLGSEVPPGEEDWLRVYHWDGTAWQPLPTQLDTYHNNASAAIQGPGLYALMSSIEIPLYGPGWNNFGYPVQATRLVTQALQLINTHYSTVYWYNAADAVDPWKMYDMSAPAWLNDLSTLKFTQAYWISVTQNITLYFSGGGTAAPNGNTPNLQGPPATFYGAVLASPIFTPTSGMTVTAWINGKLCGQGQTQIITDQIVYGINVFADGPGGAAGCGVPGRQVTFKVGSHIMTPFVTWDNNKVWPQPLSKAFQVYLPLILRPH